MTYLAIIFLTVLIFAITAIELRARQDILALPLICAAVFGYLYVFLPLMGLLDGGILHLVAEASVTWAVLVPALMLVSLSIGWWISMPPTTRAHMPGYRFGFPIVINYGDEVMYVGLFVGVTGLLLWCYFLHISGGFGNFYGSVKGVAGAWEQTTAWVYSGPYFVLSGISCLIFSTNRQRRTSIGLSFWLAVFILSMTVHGILGGRRSIVFVLGAVLVTSWMLSRGARPAAWKCVCGILVLSFLMLAVLIYRPALHLNTSLEEFAARDMDDVSRNTYAPTEGNEFAVHAAVLATVDQLGKYGLSQRHLWRLVFHPIPGKVWPGKAALLQSTGSVTAKDMSVVVGWYPTSGSACGAVADLYREWGIFSVVLWFLLGVIGARLYVRAREPGRSVTSGIIYTSMLACSLHFLAQGFNSAVELFLLMSVPVVFPIYFFRLNALGPSHRGFSSSMRTVQV